MRTLAPLFALALIPGCAEPDQFPLSEARAYYYGTNNPSPAPAYSEETYGAIPPQVVYVPPPPEMFVPFTCMSFPSVAPEVGGGMVTCY